MSPGNVRALTAPNTPASAAQELERAEPASGLLVVAPDRGFLGNTELLDAAAATHDGRAVEVAFATDERTRDSLTRALGALAQRGVTRVRVAPFFLSRNDPRYQLSERLLARDPKRKTSGLAPGLTLDIARPFGESYLAVEVLADRLRGIESPRGKRLVIFGGGARDAESRRALEADLSRIARHAANGFGFASVDALVWYDPTAPEQDSRNAEVRAAFDALGKGAARTVVVPFQLGAKYDSMMTEMGRFRQLAGKSEFITADITPDPGVSTWITLEEQRSAPLSPKDLGIVLLAHGADLHWNEAMQNAVLPLAGRYKIEFAFSMADEPVVERAVRRLEARGARAIVVLRVFGRSSSFRSTVERMIGLDTERGQLSSAALSHAAMAHAHGMSRDHDHAPRARIRASVPMTTVGGLEDDPLFARALLDRARGHSRSPAKETLILVAHGSGSDEENTEWLALLERIAAHMKENGGEQFRAIRVATWREDWPDKRAPWIPRVRSMVEEARRDGGKAIVIPARTTAVGPERELLRGLEYELASGFAPHPLFEEWLEKQIQLGLKQLESQGSAPPAPLAPEPTSGTPATRVEAPRAKPAPAPTSPGHHHHH